MTDESHQVILITAAQLPKPDLETHLLLDSLVQRGVRTTVLPWNTKLVIEQSLVVVRSPWDYFERPEEFLAWAAIIAKKNRLVNPYQVLKWNIHKEYMLDLELRGIPSVHTRLIRASDVRGVITSSKVVELTALGFQGDTVVKPAYSVGAIGLHRGVVGSLELSAHAYELLASGRDVLVQPFVPSVQDKGEISLVFFAGQFSHAVRKVPKDGDFRVQDHYGGSVKQHTASDREIEVANQAISCAPEQTAYARVDLVEGDDGEPMVMELELIEPELFLRYSKSGLQTFADHLVILLQKSG